MRSNNLHIIIFTICVIIPIVMGTISPEPKVFFQKQIAGNLTKITWAHAVNNREKLNKTLADDKIMMIEADVVMGTIINGTNVTLIPIMAHPPNVTSDLSVEMFLKDIVDNGKHGVKLDFKSIDAFKGSLSILKQFHDRMTFPVWLNADILTGPGSTNSPVDANAFLSEATNTFPESILSIGWTTSSHPIVIENNTSGNYTPQQIQEMIDTLSKNNITQTVTYPVRAGIAANTVSLWSELLKNTTKNHATLTIWSGELDHVDAKKLSKLIKDIGVEKVYVDVPNKLWKELDISAAADNLPGMFMIVAMFAANFVLNIF